jgi:hypothetical protein
MSTASTKSGNRAFLVLAILALCVVVVTGVRLYLTATGGFGAQYISGAWLSLAHDLREGVFYRPLYSPELGFGGTRYFPLSFVILAPLLSVVRDPWVAGTIFNLLSIIALAAGLFRFLRDAGVQRNLSLVLSVLPLATLAVQESVNTLRCDLLCAALNVWGLYFFVRWEKGRAALLPCVTLFVLAFATKMTGVFGAVGVAMYLLLHARRRLPAFLLSMAAGIALFLTVFVLATGGRIVEILAVCSDGGLTLWSLVKSPWEILGVLTAADGVSLLLFFLAILSFTGDGEGAFRSVRGAAFVSAGLVTVLVFSSPGVWINHFAEVVVAAVLVLGPAAGKELASGGRMYATGLAIACAISLALFGRGVFVYDMHRTARSDIDAVLTSIGNDGRPLIAEDPLVPLVAGEQVYAPEPYMIRMVTDRIPVLRDHLLAEIRAQRFRAIIFLNDPLTKREWYDQIHFGRAFMEQTFVSYVRGKQMGKYVVYVPRPVP